MATCLSKDTLGVYCPRCGKDVSRDIIRCSNCGTPLSTAPPRSGMLLASGALGIVASALYLIAGIICIFGSYEMWIQQQQPVAFSSQYYYQILELAALGILNLVSFGLSLTAGVLTLDRKHVTWLFRILIVAIVGPIIPFGASFTAPQIFFGLNSVVLFFVFFSLPAICLDVVALIFIALRREDFPKF